MLKAHQEHPEKAGLSVSLGLLAYATSRLGDSHLAAPINDIGKEWLRAAFTEEMSSVCKISKLGGLIAMIGSEQICIRGSTSRVASSIPVSEVIKTVSKFVSTSADLEVQKYGAWMLGHLHQSVCSDSESKSTVPPSYGYLPETSFLRAGVDFLLDAGRGEKAQQSSKICSVLRSLISQHPLPPLDWSGLLIPFMRANYDELVRTLCIQVAVSQMNGSPSASSFISSWLTPPLFHSLSMSSQAALHRCLPQIIRSVTPGILKLYLERSCTPAFTDLIFNLKPAALSSGADRQSRQREHEDQALNERTRAHHLEARAASNNLVLSILAGLRDALAIPDPPQSITLLLFEATGRFYQLLPLVASEPCSQYYMDLLRAMSECLTEVPDDIVDSILAADFMDATSQLKGSFTRCYLVATSRQPISFLNVMVDAAFNVPGWNQAMGIGLLAHCLAVMLKEEAADPGSHHQWLQELLGHTCSIATGAWPLADSAPALHEVIHFLMNFVTCVILVFTSPVHDDLVLWGLDFGIFTGCSKMLSGLFNSISFVEQPYKQENMESLQQTDILMEDLLNYLPLTAHALTCKPWVQVLPKATDWLLTVIALNHTGDKDKHILHAALMSLRHTQEFRQASVWTKTISF